MHENIFNLSSNQQLANPNHEFPSDVQRRQAKPPRAARWAVCPSHRLVAQQGAARSSVTMTVGVFSTKSPGFPHLLKEADSRMSITENRKKPNRETHQPKYTSKT